MSRQFPMIIVISFTLCGSAVAHGQGRGTGGPPPPGGSGMGRAPGMPPGSPSNRGNNGGGWPPANSTSNSGSNASPGSGSGHPSNITSRSGVRLGPPGRWWDDRILVQAVGLRRDQQKKIDAIFNANKPAIIESYKAYQTEKSKLDALAKNQQLDKAKMFASIDSVNQAHSTLEKANMQMLLQIREQLDPAQIAKLDDLP